MSSGLCPNSVVLGTLRFEFITGRLLRIEYAADGVFEDRLSLKVENRDAGPIAITRREEPGRTILATPQGVEVSVGASGKFDADNLTVTFKGGRWSPGAAATGNLGGAIRTLDNSFGDTILCPEQEPKTQPYIPEFKPIKLQDGFLSRDGWSFIDDSASVLLDENNWVTPRREGARSDGYLLCHGRDYRGALADAALVFGAQPLPPKFTLGYWWSRYWAYSDEELFQLADQAEQYGIPFSVMVIDMDWHLPGWTGYTWDDRYFPDPEFALKHFHNKGIRTSLNLHPATGVARFEKAFVPMAEALGVDPDKTEHIEFDCTSSAFMEQYFKILHHPQEKIGVDFWWLDWQQGTKTKMDSLDPLPWLNMCHWRDMEKRAASERENRRPLIFSRYGGVGAGRFNIGFSGDTYSVWEGLAYQPGFTASGANVLYGYWSHDIGGHVYGDIEPELYARWIQFGCYSPILRTHTTKNPAAERRVWEYPDPYDSVMIAAIRRRFELQNYIYSENERAFRTGVSLVHHLYVDWPECEDCYKTDAQYMFGSQMMVAPVVHPADPATGLAAVRCYLPEGRWYETARGEFFGGGRWIERNYLINEVPVFVRPGAVVPFDPSGKVCEEALAELGMEIYPGADSGSYELYEDDGVTMEYLHGACARITMQYERVDGKLRVSIRRKSGIYANYRARRRITLRLCGIAPVTAASCDGRELAFSMQPVECGFYNDYRNNRIVLTIPECDLDNGVNFEITESNALPCEALQDLRGISNRLVAVTKTMHDMLGGNLFPDDRLAQELSHTMVRISRHPESFAAELTQLREKLPRLEHAADFIGRHECGNVAQRMKRRTRLLALLADLRG